MCCFSQPVELVSGTSIFARGVDGHQCLVYSMTYAATGDLAMVLPLPVPAGSPEDAVRFINLEDYPEFFEDMRQGFPAGAVLLSEESRSTELVGEALAVHKVGNFEASFVPSMADFDRLDARFRIAPAVWEQLPAYRDDGFAVFKLLGRKVPDRKIKFISKVLGRSLDDSAVPLQVHPMAFEFPRRNPKLLYFPTVHVHDGKVHADAHFDHALYCQAGPEMHRYLDGWDESFATIESFVDVDRAEGLVDPENTCWRRPLRGLLENKDTRVGAGGVVPEPIEV